MATRSRSASPYGSICSVLTSGWPDATLRHAPPARVLSPAHGPGRAGKAGLAMDDGGADRSARQRGIARGEAAIAAGLLEPTDRSDDFVIGTQNPELFMPHELMERLFGGFHPDVVLQREYRRKWLERGAAQYLGDGFWDRLYAAVRPFIIAKVVEIDIGEESAGVPDPTEHAFQERWIHARNAVCPARARALAAAREVFGRENFDAFLYQAVAPDAVMGTKLPDVSKLPGQWRWEEEGCR
jgi:hypothetical protein